MYDYTTAKRFQIENVDRDIHILGVKVAAWPICVFGFALTMPFNPMVALFIPIIIGSVARLLTELELIGNPVELNQKVQKLSLRFPLLKSLPGDLTKIRIQKGK